jgi:type IV fimbrial biogenesis protein FimT
MQLKSCQRGVSLIGVRRPGIACGRASARGPIRRGERGFTMVELLITIAVAAVLIVIAVPSFRNITLSNKLTTAANDVISAINVARMEAVKRNANTQLCSNSASVNTADTLGTACTTEIGAVYTVVVVGATPTPTRVLAGTAGITGAVQLKGDMKAIRFSGQGLGQAVGTAGPYSGKVADICTSQMSANNHREIWMTAGSILETRKTTGACP